MLREKEWPHVRTATRFHQILGCSNSPQSSHNLAGVASMCQQNKKGCGKHFFLATFLSHYCCANWIIKSVVRASVGRVCCHYSWGLVVYLQRFLTMQKRWQAKQWEGSRGGFPQSVLLRSTFHGEINEACSCLSELFLLIERSRLIQFGIAAVYEESFGVKDI